MLLGGDVPVVLIHVLGIPLGQKRRPGRAAVPTAKSSLSEIFYNLLGNRPLGRDFNCLLVRVHAIEGDDLCAQCVQSRRAGFGVAPAEIVPAKILGGGHWRTWVEKVPARRLFVMHGVGARVDHGKYDVRGLPRRARSYCDGEQ